MKFGASSILGLAVGDREISCAQLGSGRVVQKLLHFPLPAGMSLDQPEVVGAQLRQALRQHHVTAHRAVVGIPARWLIAQEREVPPSDEAQAYAVLRLQAERLSLGDGAGVVFDAAGRPDVAKPVRLLLVGALQQQVERLRKLCEAAGVTPVAITSTALVLSHLLESAENRPLVVLSRQGAEMVWHHEGSPRMLRHLPSTEASPGGAMVAALGGELRRALAMGATSATSRELLLWQDRNLSAQDLAELSSRTGLQVQTDQALQSLSARLRDGALNGAADTTDAESFGPAVALAIAAASRRLPVDFLHSRLAPQRTSRIGRRTMLIAALVVLLIGGISYLYTTVQQREAEALELEQRLEERRPDVARAQGLIDRVNYARGYFESRTPVLDCLREITLSYRPGESIWTTSFTLRENGRGQLQGRSVDQRTVLAVRDRLMGNPSFSNVQLLDMREGTGQSRDVTFSITFTFSPVE